MIEQEVFSNFLESIFNCYNLFFNLFKSLYNLIISNNWIILLICVSIFFMILDSFADINDVIFNILHSDFLVFKFKDKENIKPILKMNQRNYKNNNKRNNSKELFDYNWLDED